MSVARLLAGSMPADRKELKHVVVGYDNAAEEGGENADKAKAELVVQALPVTELERELLQNSQQPPKGSKILLHSCCAPCSGAMVEEMWHEMELEVTIMFYNPNIHPKREYEIRKEENKTYAARHGIPFVDCDYDADSWYVKLLYDWRTVPLFYWHIRKPWSSSIILYNNNTTAHNHHVDNNPF